jgi:mono/diheme cytochrome c family protein
MKKNTLYAAAALAAALGTAAAARADAKDNWTANCASCHGPDGAGHTKAGRLKQVKDFTDPKTQAGFTDDEAATQIKGGKKDAAGKELMKAFGDKFTDADVKDLVAYVRAFKKQP